MRAAAEKLGGESLAAEEAARFWEGVREQTDPFFAGDAPLWRLSLPAQAPVLELPGEQLLEWGGALRWLKSSADAASRARRRGRAQAAMRRCSARAKSRPALSRRCRRRWRGCTAS